MGTRRRLRAEITTGHGTAAAEHATVTKERQIEELLAAGLEAIGQLSEREFLVAGTALYAGEGAKRDGSLRFANTDPRMILFFVTWLRAFYSIDESRLRLRLYLHDGLALDEAERVLVTADGHPPFPVHQAIPRGSRSLSASREARDGVSMRRLFVQLDASQCRRPGCGAIVNGLPSGVAQLAERRTVKPFVVGSSPTPGAR